MNHRGLQDLSPPDLSHVTQYLSTRDLRSLRKVCSYLLKQIPPQRPLKVNVWSKRDKFMRDFEWLCGSNLEIYLTLPKDELKCYDDLSMEEYDSDHYNHHGSSACMQQMKAKVVDFVTECHHRIVEIEVYEKTSHQFLQQVLPKLKNIKVAKLCCSKMPGNWYTAGRPGFEDTKFWNSATQGFYEVKCDIYNGKPVLQYLTNIFLNLTEENGEHLEYLELSDPYFDFLFKNKTKQDFPNLKEIFLHGCKWQRMNGEAHHWVFKRIQFGTLE